MPKPLQKSLNPKKVKMEILGKRNSAFALEAKSMGIDMLRLILVQNKLWPLIYMRLFSYKIKNRDVLAYGGDKTLFWVAKFQLIINFLCDLGAMIKCIVFMGHPA